MKLSFKIFLGIFIPSMISIFIISNLLINKYVDGLLTQEIDKSYQEFKNINTSIKGVAYNDYELPSFLDEFTNYFNNKGLYVTYYRNNNKVYSNNDLTINNDLISVKDNKYNSYYNKVNGNNHLYISMKNNYTDVIVFSKNINYIYKTKNNLVNICIITCLGLVLTILVVAYIISKTLTKPLKKIEKEVKNVASGNYDINLSEGKDEIGSLAHSINIMSNEIKNRNDDLVELLDNKQLFIDNLSHEMNTPLTSIYGYIELFEKANLDEENKYKALSYMKNETKRIIDMQKKLLMLSYKENTNIELNNINLENVYEQLSIELKDKINNKNMKLIFDNQVNEFKGDELLVSLAISNLIRNAINNSNPNTTIEVHSYIKDNNIYIDVKDQGCGISKENIEKITEPFYRVDKARSRKDGGAGLGLSIVKKIMNMHKGELKIVSEIDKGSIFTLKFPI